MPQDSQTGFFVSFEGSEGCGKSTQIRLLVESLFAAGNTPVVVREPGGTSIGETIRHLLQHSVEGRAMSPKPSFFSLQQAGPNSSVRKSFPHLQAGRIVISDRFLDSTTVYQGVARNIAPEIVGERQPLCSRAETPGHHLPARYGLGRSLPEAGRPFQRKSRPHGGTAFCFL